MSSSRGALMSLKWLSFGFAFADITTNSFEPPAMAKQADDVAVLHTLGQNMDWRNDLDEQYLNALVQLFEEDIDIGELSW